ncbi:hypothetical protein BLOT_002321 [Blomia tropicalis]|nr:hypothetical protein BLOT_002321 [Blomia tropicalis]
MDAILIVWYPIVVNYMGQMYIFVVVVVAAADVELNSLIVGVIELGSWPNHEVEIAIEFAIELVDAIVAVEVVVVAFVEFESDELEPNLFALVLHGSVR